MKDIDPNSAFGGLPLTEGQDAAIRHYIRQHQHNHEPIDALELAAMLKDMLYPPGDGVDGDFSGTDDYIDAAERAAACVDEAMNPIEASEERNAAMEAETMKGSRA